MIFAQISDTHVSAEPDHPHNQQLRTVVECINRTREKPAFVLATGDLANCGEGGEYEQLDKILSALDMPLYVIPGNHDNRELLLDLYRNKGYLPIDPPHLHYAINHHAVRIIALDTKEGDEQFGRLCEDRLHWLSVRLAEDRDYPTVIMMHHPPFDTGVKIMDADRCLDGAEFATVVSESHNVERILCGHVHRGAFTRFANTVASVCPSTAFHLEPLINVDSKNYTVVDERPAFQLHMWSGEAGLVTHTIRVPQGYTAMDAVS